MPNEILQAGNIGPVLPKFDFYDPLATSVPVQTTTIESVSTGSTIPQTSEKNTKNVVELKFNGKNQNSFQNIENKSTNKRMTYEAAVFSTMNNNVDITLANLETTSKILTSDPNPTQGTITREAGTTTVGNEIIASPESPSEVATSGSTASSTSGSNSVSTNAIDESHTAGTVITNRGGIVIPTFGE